MRCISRVTLFAALATAPFGFARAASESVVYSFKGGSDGAHPYAGLLNQNGILFGTTAEGGPGNCQNGCGTIFKVTTTGIETVIHAFKGGRDGAVPVSGVINVAGSFYGTTQAGGAHTWGTAYKVTPAGAEAVLHAFKNVPDGYLPNSNLIELNGRLYGTTAGGGVDQSDGTVFKLTTAGIEKVLYAFTGGSDGLYPVASLTNVGGVLYGTTLGGGASNAGTVFKVTTAGVETVLYAFKDGSDGSAPAGGLVNVGGTLYGTTQYGGGSGCSPYPGCGTVFAVMPDGSEKVLYAFKGGNDGFGPVAGLINVGGTLYGTTQNGGASGAGTVFQVTTAGVESVVYSFRGGMDAGGPLAGLINVGGTLYGTAYGGGANNKGAVFAVTP